MDKEMSTTSINENSEENELEIDEDKLRGDAIGETLYSGRWVLQTVMNLTKEIPNYSKENANLQAPVELETSLETDLCTLWDMSADKDVSLFLLSNDIPSILLSVISDSIAPRLTEICVGVLGNMVCYEDVFKNFIKDPNLLDVIEDILDNPDSQCVLQGIRFFNTCAWHCGSDELLSLIQRLALWNSIAFVLQNSLNEELLQATLNLLDSLLEKVDTAEILEQIPSEGLITGILDSMHDDLQAEEKFHEDFSKDFVKKLTWSIHSICKLFALKPSICSTILTERIDDSILLISLYITSLLDTEDTAEIVNYSFEIINIWNLLLDSTNISFSLLIKFARLGLRLMEIPINDEAFKALQSEYCEKFANIFQILSTSQALESFVSFLKSADPDVCHFICKSISTWNPLVFEELKSIAEKLNINRIIDAVKTVEKINK